MVPELEKARVTEIHVRMDCHGCVQKIKKALHGIDGIYNITIDFARQRVTVVGWADPEKIMKAIKKTRKIATICSHKEVDPPAPATDPAPADPPPPQPQPEAPPAADPPASDNQPAPPPPEEPKPETPAPKEEVTTPSTAAPDQPPTEATKEVEEIHVVQHIPAVLPPYDHPIYYSGGGHGFRRVQEAVPYHVVMTHNYNTHHPSSSLPEYELYQRTPAIQYLRHGITTDYVDGDYDYNYNGRDRRDGSQITSIFSDENPNACSIA